MSDAAKDFGAQFAAIRHSFIDGLPRRAADLRGAAQPLHADDATAAWGAAVVEVAAHAHKLAGSAGTFGFTAIGDMARELEHLCTNLIEDARQPTVTERQMLIRLVATIDERTLASTADSRAPGKPSPAAASGPEPIPEPEVDAGASSNVLLSIGEGAVADRLAAAVKAAGYTARKIPVGGLLSPAALALRPSAAIIDLDAMAGGPIIGVPDAGNPGVAASPFPIIALASGGDFSTRLCGARVGCEELLIKPVSEVDLVTAISRLADTAVSQPYRVLVIDDDVDLANHTTLVLRQAGMIAEVLSDPTKVLEKIAAFAPELLLVDLHMPVCTGAELSAVIRQQEELAAIPIVFLSQETDAERQVQAMGHGGDEFLLKSVEARHLVAAVRARARRFRQLRTLLMRDSLTGLLNHSTTLAMLEAEIRRAGRSNLSVVLAIIDIDHFKKVNDVHGHAVGDEVIKSLATLLRQGLRNSEIVGRVGGEEFAAAMVGIDIDAAIQRFDALRQDFARIAHRARDGVLHTTFSCGVAAFPCYPDAKSLSKAADEALYAAKDGGRNRVVVAAKATVAEGAIGVGR